MIKLLIGLSLVVLFAAGCEEKDDDKINQAQKCLDEARLPADAAGCSALINGINNEKANRIRCALTVLENGTTQDEIIDAFKAMDSGSQDPVIEVATKLGLGDLNSDTNVDAHEVGIAEDIKEICYQSESIGLKTVAQLIVFGTKAQAAVGVGDPEDPADVAADIANMTDNDAGEFANDVFDLYCVPTFSNEDICGSLSGAGAGTDDAATVGAALKACLAANNCG